MSPRRNVSVSVSPTRRCASSSARASASASASATSLRRSWAQWAGSYVENNEGLYTTGQRSRPRGGRLAETGRSFGKPEACSGAHTRSLRRASGPRPESHLVFDLGKKLRLSKSHAESLSRALNDQSRHALGGGGGHPTGAAAVVVVDVFYSTATPHRVGVRTARAYFPPTLRTGAAPPPLPPRPQQLGDAQVVVCTLRVM